MPRPPTRALQIEILFVLGLAGTAVLMSSVFLKLLTGAYLLKEGPRIAALVRGQAGTTLRTELPAAPAPLPRREPTTPAHHAFETTVEAVRRSVHLGEARKRHLLLRLRDGLHSIEECLAARGALGPKLEWSEFDWDTDDLDSASEEASAAERRFVAQCGRIRAALTLLQVRDADEGALGRVDAAIDDLGGRVDAQREMRTGRPRISA